MCQLDCALAHTILTRYSRSAARSARRSTAETVPCVMYYAGAACGSTAGFVSSSPAGGTSEYAIICEARVELAGVPHCPSHPSPQALRTPSPEVGAGAHASLHSSHAPSAPPAPGPRELERRKVARCERVHAGGDQQKVRLRLRLSLSVLLIFLLLHIHEALLIRQSACTTMFRVNVVLVVVHGEHFVLCSLLYGASLRIRHEIADLSMPWQYHRPAHTPIAASTSAEARAKGTDEMGPSSVLPPYARPAAAALHIKCYGSGDHW
ncbi:hypothetical protein GGX14DRAFT_569814 [Mycena pura]|uniref:Uncharacterized protein n=1 Tax=Mycena pura TaxID=153505 RepID=A0AAD6YBD0_9AGAR|nr:hypothetical protein GGX14DRAFT_569814 [Mycena pura]